MTIDCPPLIDTVAPTEAAEVAEVVRNACRDGVPVYPIGGGTALDYGGRPGVPGVGLSLDKLNRVIDYPAEDMTITVEAGIPVAQLAKHLAVNRQRLPLDVPDAERATIGGVVAANPSGPRRYAYGTMRDYLIGFRAVDGRGNEFGGGGRVVKNAAGYDLCKLMVGSLGTMGVITQVTLMVRPVPQTSALVVCEVPDFSAAERLLAGLVHTKTLPVAVELLAGPRQPPSPVLGPMLESSAARIIVGFEGSEAEVDWMVQQICGEWAEIGINSPVTIPAENAALGWNWLGNLPADVQAHVLGGAAVPLVERLLQGSLISSLQAHAGNGVIRCRLSPSETPLAQLLGDQLRPAVAEAGGTMIVLSHPDGQQLTAEDVWGPAGNAATLIGALRERFDPQALLNPGRLA